MSKNPLTLRTLMVAWLLLSACVLVLTLYYFDGTGDSDIDVFLIWAMTVLSFPSGMIVVLVAFGVSYVLQAAFSIVVQVSWSSLLLTWLAFLLAGYLQWFIGLPLALAKIRTHRARHSADSHAGPRFG